MINISLFKFSRYFFALFILITVIPLISILLWSDYMLKQTVESRQAHFASFIMRDTLSMFHGYLNSEKSNIIRLVGSGQKHTDLEYQEILGADQVAPLGSAIADNLLKKYSLYIPKISNQVFIDYLVLDKQLKYIAIVPRKSSGTLLVIKTVPTQIVMPPGPFAAEIFAGKTTEKSQRLFSLPPKLPDFEKGHHRKESPPFFMVFHEEFHERGAFHGPPPEFDGPPPPFMHGGPEGPPPPFMMHDSEGPPHHRPPGMLRGRHHVMGRGGLHHRMDMNHMPGENATPKLVYLKDTQGKTVATIRLLIFSPPSPSMIFGTLGQWMTVFILLTGITTSLLAGRYLQKNFIEPLARLSIGTRKVQSGDLSVRLETEDIRQPDVRQTLDNFNHMLAGLLEKEQLRNNFISNLTHDFRTPLVAQTRSLEILSSEFQALGLSEQQQLAQGILKNNQHLLMMVNQLLETYQTEAGMIALDLQDVSMPELAAQCFEQLSSLATERNITFTTDFSDQFPVIQADPYYLKRVLINLLGNAIDNIPKGCKIQINGTYPVSDTLLPNMVEIHVKDNGPGISEQDQKHLFERYYVGGDTRKLGSGLGLYVCAVLVAAHQGTIQVHSVPGGGTDFIIRIPVSKGEGYGKTTDNGSIG